jgi:predicted Zn finger-like uncharacterized protein
MAEVFLTCPQCQRQLRVTDELLGRPVKCPVCEFTFTVAPGSTEPEALPALPAAPGEWTPAAPPEPAYDRRRDFEEDGGRHDEWDLDRSRRARGLVMPPAIALLIVSILSMLADLLNAALFATNHELVKQQMELFKQILPWMAPQTLATIYAVYAGLSLLLIPGSIQMLRMKTYPFAIFTSLLAIINWGNCCGCLGAAFGIWALVVLYRPEVREAFH